MHNTLDFIRTEHSNEINADITFPLPIKRSLKEEAKQIKKQTNAARIMLQIGITALQEPDNSD
jgi:hypothetical protein